MSKLPNTTVYFGLSGLVFLLAGGYAFSLFGAIGDKGGELARLKAEAMRPEDLQAELEAAQLESAQSAAQLAHLEKSVPEVAYVPTMLKELEQFGKASGVQVFGVRPFIAVTSEKDKKRKLAKPYTELSIEIKGKGKYRSVLKFVEAMKTFPKIVAVRTVGINPKAMTTGEMGYSNLDITIELRAYLFKPQKGEELAFPIEIVKPEGDKSPKPGEVRTDGAPKPGASGGTATASRKGGSLES